MEKKSPFLRFEKVASSNDSGINRGGLLIAISLISLLCFIVSAFQLFLSEFDFATSTINVFGAVAVGIYIHFITKCKT